MLNRLKLYLHKDIYDDKGTATVFAKAIYKNVIFHNKHCYQYQKILNYMKFRPEQIKDIKDLSKVPVITTAYLKGNRMSSMKAWRLPIKATSSGTSGNKSHVGFNLMGLFFAAVLAYKMTRFHHLLSFKRTNYLILGYEPHKSNQTVITKTQRLSTFFAPAKHREYALKYKGNAYEIDFEGLKKALERYSKEKCPVRLVGLPSYTLFLLRELQKSQLSYQLPPNSMVLLGGGWKGHYKERVDKEELYSLLGEVLGIAEENCREFFGVAEHPALYCSCSNHHFHVPIYSRVIIRDVYTLKELPYGQVGIVNLLTPLADSMPLTSIMTDDLGILHEGSKCKCGIQAPYLEIIGRVGMGQIQTCAVSADEFLKAVE